MKETNGIILFGDSVFLGIGASHNDFGCGVVLKSKLQMPVLIKAQSRDTTKDALKRIETDVLSEIRYTYILILFGNNDCRLVDINTPKVTLEEYKENLMKVIHLLIDNQKLPIISNLQPLDDKKAFDSLLSIRKFARGIQPNDWQKRYSDACKDVAIFCGVNFIDIRTELEKERDSVIASDGLHPNDTGHRLIASIIEKEIKNIMQETVPIHNEG